MILHFDPSRPAAAKAGFSLLETLVVLAILALILTVILPSMHGPSPTLILQRKASEIVRKAQQTQLLAIEAQEVQLFEMAEDSCDKTIQQILFFPDGTASGPDICLQEADVRLTLTLAPLNGHFTEAKE